MWCSSEPGGWNRHAHQPDYTVAVLDFSLQYRRKYSTQHVFSTRTMSGAMITKNEETHEAAKSCSHFPIPLGI